MPYTGTLKTENNAIDTIVGGLLTTDSVLELNDISGFPTLVDPEDFCILTLIRVSDGAIEYVKCTDQNVANRTYTVVRAQENTNALEFQEGDQVRNMLTRDQINMMFDGSSWDVNRVADTSGPITIDTSHYGKMVYVDNDVTIPAFTKGGFYCTVMNKAGSQVNLILDTGVTSPNIISTLLAPAGSLGVQYRTGTEVWLDGNMIFPS